MKHELKVAVLAVLLIACFLQPSPTRAQGNPDQKLARERVCAALVARPNVTTAAFSLAGWGMVGAVRLVKTSSVFNGRASSDEERVFDRDGRLVSVASTHKLGAQIENVTYDRNGAPIEMTWFDPAVDRNAITNFIYDDSQRLVEERTTDPKTGVAYKWVNYTHDETRCSTTELIRMLFNGRILLVDETVYTHLGDGRWLHAFYQRNPLNGGRKLAGKTVYSYNAAGLLTETVGGEEDDPPDDKWVFTYVYDARGNWVEMRTRHIVGGVADTDWLTRREVIYYGDSAEIR